MADHDLGHRKAACRVLFTDRNGKALANKKIHIEQRTHEFLFGCGAFDLMPVANGMEGEKADHFNERAEKWFSLYNYGTLPFYLGTYEPVEGKPEKESRMKTALYMKERGAEVKGHPLCWHTVCADYLMKYDNATILDKLKARITRDVSEFKGVIDKWDVINEVVIMPVFDKYDNAVTRVCKEIGRVNIVKETFRAAYEENPEAELLLNDFNTSPDYEKLIDECLDAGIPISTIGIQSHQHQGYWGKDKLYDVLERFSRFGLPIHFTENTLVSGSLIPPEIDDLNDWQVSEWPSTPEGEERQMKETEEMYRILFADPNVKAITGWDFADGAWLNAPSGLIRKDNSEKPVYKRLKEMINEEWHTDENVVTDENGYAMISGFKGKYEAGSEEGKASFVLNDEKTDEKIVLR